MNRLFLTLPILMGVVVIVSNYLVQFPVKYYNLEELLINTGVKNFKEIIGKQDN